ncbi:LysM peptidoglycan-binding domain-containing protein [Clavibacter nebraskensis]|uniref:LysM peptidoglycan-binding domain-containing protein n=1 Tax=Clavibacter nebraskensis TaxID=31963 RepID=UPI003F4C9223
MRKILTGLGSLIALVAIIGGVPAVLLIAAGNPIPTPDQLHSIVTLTPDYGNVILLTRILPLVGWVAWALFAIPMLFEIAASIAGRTTSKRSWAFKGQQQLAATMIAAVLVMFASSGGVQAASAAPAHSDTARTTASAPQAPATVTAPETATAVAASPAPVAAAPATVDVQHTVVHGDTLWDLAEHYYGDGARNVDIYKASAGITQPGGAHLSNPDRILPGWQLVIPGVAAAQPAPTPAPAPAPDSASTSGAAAATSSSSTADVGAPSDLAGGAGGGGTVQDTAPSTQAETEAPAAAPSAAPAPPVDAAASAGAGATASDDVDLSIPLTTAGGIGALLAAALLAALGRRRQMQRRKRQPGTRIAMPQKPASDLELELRMVEDPLGITDIDNALRGLQIWAEDTDSALPELFALRLETSEIALYLTGPAELPAPFVKAHPDGTAWVITPGTALTPSRESVSPYPALITIGVDERDGVLMLDLEQIGSLNITGDDATARGLLNAMAVELAENPWSDQIQVTLVGMPHGLARDLNRFRVQHVDDVDALVRNIRHDLQEREHALASYGIGGVHAGRVHATEAESWAPHIVILAEVPSEEKQTELAELVDRIPRLGVATVSNGATVARGSTIELNSRTSAQLISAGGSMPPLPFAPQLLDGEELRLIQQLFDTTQHESVPAPARVDEIPAAAPVLSDTLTDQADVDLTPAHVDEVSAAADAADVAEVAVPEVDEAPVLTEVDDTVPAKDVPVAAAAVVVDESPSWPAPYVRLLGPVDALHLADEDAMPGRGVELMAYLLLNGRVEGRQLQMAFWPDTTNASNNQRGLAKKVRLALGHSPTGELLLPENVNHQGYTLHPAIRSDWDDFRDLIGPDLSRTPNEDLVQAIKLVRGQPFSGCNTRRWWQWISIPLEEMIAAVMDAADELGRRALNEHDSDQARFAARVAQSVDPLNEAGWRTELRAAMQTGDTEEFRRIVDAMYARVSGTDPDYELDDETQDLVAAGDRQQ